jgi:very-short-patch-repair endonuclease
VLSAGVQQGLTTTARLRTCLDGELWACRRKLVREVLADIEGGSHSLPELRFLAALREANLPLPDRQVVRSRPSGRAYVDAHWDDARLTVEIDGAGHLDPRAWVADLARQNDLIVGGDRVLRFPSFVIRDQPDDVVAMVAAALAINQS